jgi:hypothetical protein
MASPRTAFRPKAETRFSLPQILSVSISATFNILQGQVAALTWEFREDLYTSVRLICALITFDSLNKAPGGLVCWWP